MDQEESTVVGGELTYSISDGALRLSTTAETDVFFWWWCLFQGRGAFLLFDQTCRTAVSDRDQYHIHEIIFLDIDVIQHARPHAEPHNNKVTTAIPTPRLRFSLPLSRICTRVS